MNPENLKSEIKKLAASKKAVILAHNYQPAEIQDMADRTGDSLELSRFAAQTGAEIIVFCGVHFMAESASILSPAKKVLLPDLRAGCPMADMASAEDITAMKRRHPDAAVVTYINSTAEAKAVSDVVCTSSNAVKIVNAVDAKKIIFVPDKNLGSYVRRFTDKEIILWDGFCPVHDAFTKEEFIEIKKKHPDAYAMVHPECRPEVIDMADGVFSTGGMIEFVKSTDKKKIIVGTETGMMHRLKSAAPRIEFIPASGSFVCPDMKKIDLKKVYDSLRDETPVVRVTDAVRERASAALRRMLDLS